MGLTLFRDCASDYKFRFDLMSEHSNVGDVFKIDGIHFNGFASVIEYDETGDVFDSNGTLFVEQENCPDIINLYQSIGNYSTFCVSNFYPTLSTNVGNFFSAGTDGNSKIYYSGETSGWIYYKQNISQWCLSSTLGGDCLSFGKKPCTNLTYPDLYSGIVSVGSCPTPTPSLSSCEVIDFNAYFNCEISATTTPTPTMSVTPTNTITPTPTKSSLPVLGVSFGLSAYTYTYPSSTPSVTPSVTPTNNVQISGAVLYDLIFNSFSFNGVRVMVDCNTQETYYVSQDLIYSGTPVIIGDVIRVLVNNVQLCLEYVSNQSFGNSTIYIEEILDKVANCSSCLITPTPTVTPTITPTTTPTNTPTVTPTPSSNIVYVFESCLPLGGYSVNTTIIQTQSYGSALSVDSVVKDSDGNCWVYLGTYSNTYIPFGNAITFTGNYFQGSDIFIDCQSCING